MRKILFLLGLTLVLCLDSCIVSQKVTYMKDLSPSETYPLTPIPPLRIQKNDRLSIQVSAKNTELAAPFNNGGYTVNDKGITTNSGENRGYLVDQQGNIEFPILGTMNVEGMTIDGLRDFLKDQLQSKNLLSSAVVKIELVNLKVLVMGEAGNQIINAPDSRMTLLEAITRAGGLSNNAETDKITVIREENGVRKVYYNDIESKDIFTSPTFYLQQNDIVYVPQKAAPRGGDEARTWRIMSMIMSVLSMATTIFAITR